VASYRERERAAAARERAETARRAAVRLRWAAARRLAFLAAGLLLFVAALEAMKSGAGGARPLLQTLDAAGPVNAFGFGWLFAYVMLAGSPVAATSVSLLAGGTFDSAEAFAGIAGSRMGASLIVLLVGFVAYLRGRRAPDGLAVGVIALIVTFTTQVPALLLGLVSLERGWLDGVRVATPAGLISLSDATVGRGVDALAAVLPAGGMLLLGGGTLLASFWAFDRALPQLEAEAEGIRRVFRALERVPLMFIMGVLVTLTTMSVALSITVLVPLALKGYIRKEHIIPYVMGANIATFADTLVAAVLLGGDAALLVVLTEIVWVAAVSLAVLLLAYRPYRWFVLRCAGWVTASPGHMAAFLAAIFFVPAVLLLV